VTKYLLFCNKINTKLKTCLTMSILQKWTILVLFLNMHKNISWQNEHICNYIISNLSILELKQFVYSRDGEPIYYHGPHKMWKIASGPQILFNFTFKFYLHLPKENRERKLCQGEKHFSTYCLHVCLSLSFVWSWCCVPTWVTKFIMQARFFFEVSLWWP